MVGRGPLPDTVTVNPGFKLLMLIAVPRTERRARRFVAREVGSCRVGVRGSIEAA
jgi:hypothetical protein